MVRPAALFSGVFVLALVGALPYFASWRRRPASDTPVSNALPDGFASTKPPTIRVLISSSPPLHFLAAEGPALEISCCGAKWPGPGLARATIMQDGDAVVCPEMDMRCVGVVQIRGEAGASAVMYEGLAAVDKIDPERRSYPGEIRIAVPGDSIIAVNHLDMEAYVGGVTAGEIWPTFEVEAACAQAIAARTFALFHMTRRRSQAYDVSASQSSQVFRGLRTDVAGRLGGAAAEATHGLACTWNDAGVERLFCAYYSASCGGMSQAASIFGPESDAPPLRGSVSCSYCEGAPAGVYSWNPVSLPLGEAFARFSARVPESKRLGGIVDVSVLESHTSGRMTKLRIEGTAGQSIDVSAERFRMALGGSLIRSTLCQIRLEGDRIVFENGRGFGHGLGLCQWGAQGQAKLGRSAKDILAYYYPGSNLTRAY